MWECWMPRFPSGKPSDAWHKTKRWQRLRIRIIARDSAVCQMCGCRTTTGRKNPRAAEVDHIIPHRGDEARFWNVNNLQCLCKVCHSTTKQRQET
ncbi:HNH endonuclease [Paracoccus caeni]|uniref:Putative HNH nuclease YajD n=2 Tax=Paracoccus caeni TaxID=657651 RepID=A0A934VY26_9RHOB|nr:HNH endonuclease [Paracoccus caeni]